MGDKLKYKKYEGQRFIFVTLPITKTIMKDFKIILSEINKVDLKKTKPL
ncbi:MAG: hypothetical protein WDO15_16285 [Bacteroidota bacterium]